MPKKVKGSLLDMFRKDDEKEEAKKVVKKTTVKKSAPKTKKRPTMSEDMKVDKKLKEKKAAAIKEEKLMRSKTHQDLINAAYKAAEELGIAPWVLLRAAEWGHFTENRGKKYDGPMVGDIKTLDKDQKKALKKAIGL